MRKREKGIERERSRCISIANIVGRRTLDCVVTGVWIVESAYFPVSSGLCEKSVSTC